MGSTVFLLCKTFVNIIGQGLGGLFKQLMIDYGQQMRDEKANHETEDIAYEMVVCKVL